MVEASSQGPGGPRRGDHLDVERRDDGQGRRPQGYRRRGAGLRLVGRRRRRGRDDMSRIGRRPVEIPSGVEVTVDGGSNLVTVRGPRGSSRTMPPTMRSSRRRRRARRATRRPRSQPQPARPDAFTLANMVEGVTKGFEKRLQIVGVGYRAAMKARTSSCRWATRTRCSCPARRDRVRGPRTHAGRGRGDDKQLVGETAANIRKIRKPEPYKGKGIRYENEYVRKKAGKAAKGDGLMDAKTRRAARVRRHARPQDDRRHLGAAAPGRVPVQPAHLRAADRRPRAATLASASTRRSVEATARPRSRRSPAPSWTARRAPGSIGSCSTGRACTTVAAVAEEPEREVEI